MKRQRVDRSETAIPCLLIFTKPILVGGLPRNLFYFIAALAVFSLVILKNLILFGIIMVVYYTLRRINAKDETYLTGLLRMCKKKYLSY